MFHRLALSNAGLLLVAAAFELALALGAAKPGPSPGDAATGQDVVGPVAFIALAVGVVAAGLGAAKRERAIALLMPAAGLFVTATDYTYDSYYAPTLRRFSDGGAVPVWWMFVLLGISLGVGVFTWRRPGPGCTLTGFGLLVWVVTLMFAGDGH